MNKQNCLNSIQNSELPKSNHGLWFVSHTCVCILLFSRPGKTLHRTACISHFNETYSMGAFWLCLMRRETLRGASVSLWVACHYGEGAWKKSYMKFLGWVSQNAFCPWWVQIKMHLKRAQFLEAVGASCLPTRRHNMLLLSLLTSCCTPMLSWLAPTRRAANNVRMERLRRHRACVVNISSSSR